MISANRKEQISRENSIVGVVMGIYDKGIAMGVFDQ